MDEKIDQIRQDLLELTKQEYEKNGYIPTKTSAKALKNPDGVKDKEIDMEINKLDAKVNQMIYKKEKQYSTENKDKIFMNNTSDMFNIVENDKEYLEWRKLEIDKRLEVLEQFFEEYEDLENDDIKDKLRDMVKNKEILYKKDILFDKINQRILKIILLKKIDEEYVLKEDVKKVNIRKQNKSNINKLLKQ